MGKYRKFRHRQTGITGELWTDGIIHFYNTHHSDERLRHLTVPGEFVLNTNDWIEIKKK
jgi:hypothetical protein